MLKKIKNFNLILNFGNKQAGEQMNESKGEKQRVKKEMGQLKNE